MSNAKTDHSRALRAATAKAAMKKRRESADYKQLSLAGDTAIIDEFIRHLDGTGESGRIRQLAVINRILSDKK